MQTPLDKKPKGQLYLNKTFDCYSAGTRIEFIEYCDTRDGFPTGVLGRVQGIQMVVPLDLIVERRPRSQVVNNRKESK